MRRFWSEWNGIQWGCGGLVIGLAGFALALTVAMLWESPRPREPRPLFGEPLSDTDAVLWDQFSEKLTSTSVKTGGHSNIHPGDYVGPDACRTCHPKKHNDWSGHSHRWMNAIAASDTIKGDFSGHSDIRYLDGTATFSEASGLYRMHLVRDDVRRDYWITQTIGSRFFQYYIGVLEAGPEPAGHRFYTDEHVLPFGYWLTEKEWVPTVHIKDEMPDGERSDPFALQSPFWRSSESAGFDSDYAVYSDVCAHCHSTFPLGDLLIRTPENIGTHAPWRLHWDVAGYLADHRPEIYTLFEKWREDGDSTPSGSLAGDQMLSKVRDRANAVTMGISCESCHLGCREHVEDKTTLPRFFPHSEHLILEGSGKQVSDSRTPENLNWICGRCHTGSRPYYAAGFSTWNSTESSDAGKGSCYSKLTCVTCHDPHQPIGPQWSRSQAQDDANCVSCHKQFEQEPRLVEHTHHPAGSAGSGCMNCHMPRINEGMQDLVRTHAIFSPTRKEMIEANHPNACNLCHTDRKIDWTLKYLREWYGAEFSDQEIAKAYPDQDLSVGEGWLKSENSAVRLVAADALARSQGSDAASLLIEALDDEFLINRQFARRQIERLMNVQLIDFGYRFYLTPEERAEPIKKLRTTLLNGDLRPRQEAEGR